MRINKLSTYKTRSKNFKVYLLYFCNLIISSFTNLYTYQTVVKLDSKFHLKTIPHRVFVNVRNRQN